MGDCQEETRFGTGTPLTIAVEHGQLVIRPLAAE
ncbi:type I toxin-antitoxin system SymE family toxin [Buttiauxella sp. A2-C2_NF]|nr:type I toxin-antitoxin system SymE family toxin [Buttiauxella ferragutiae]MCE0829050.1 type I toxin-antitoxin system SymE family toxin [Buttiauxella ferragutiae]UNK63063.1 type I toxin-antitoxin system SymE family toxin [Buttiauxella ferragutiae]